MLVHQTIRVSTSIHTYFTYENKQQHIKGQYIKSSQTLLNHMDKQQQMRSSYFSFSLIMSLSIRKEKTKTIKRTTYLHYQII